MTTPNDRQRQAEEVWKKCARYPQYEVSNLGRVKNKWFREVLDWIFGV